jgi:hypothetical protein
VLNTGPDAIPALSTIYWVLVQEVGELPAFTGTLNLIRRRWGENMEPALIVTKSRCSAVYDRIVERNVSRKWRDGIEDRFGPDPEKPAVTKTEFLNQRLVGRSMLGGPPFNFMQSILV